MTIFKLTMHKLPINSRLSMEWEFDGLSGGAIFAKGT